MAIKSKFKNPIKIRIGNPFKKKDKKVTDILGRNLTIKIVSSFFSTIILSFFAALALYLVANIVVRYFIWRPSPLYYFLYTIDYIIYDFWFLILVVYIIIVFIFHWRKTLGYLNEVINATRLVYSNEDKLINLSSDLKEAEIMLNGLKNEYFRSQRVAKEAEQKKNDLIVYLAHDLKTPLTSVIGYLSLINDEKEITDQTKDRYLGIALDKAYHLEDLVNEFFDITRFSYASSILSTKKINLSMMLEQIVSEFEPALLDKNISMELNITQDIYQSIDTEKMKRAFDNLVQNALNYSLSDSSITVSLIDEDDHLIISFTNVAEEISQYALDHLFDQFYRVDSSRQSSSGGSGLGLAITKQIIELHNGTINATYEDGRINFVINLPKM